MGSTITEGFLDSPIFGIVTRVAEKTGVRAFVIGGYVRDCFLGRKNDDIDIVVEGSGIDLAQAVAAEIESSEHRHCNVSVFKTFGTAMLKWHGAEIEFVGARKESYRHDSRKPIVEDGTLVRPRDIFRIKPLVEALYLPYLHLCKLHDRL